MADAAIAFVLEALIDQLRGVNHNKMNTLNTELDQLASDLTQLGALLQALQDKHESTAAMEKWLKQVSEVVYDAEIIVDSTLIEAAAAEDGSKPSCIIPISSKKNQSLTAAIQSFRETRLKPLLDTAPIQLSTATERSEISKLQQEEEDTVEYTMDNFKAARQDHVVGLHDKIRTLIQYLLEELPELGVIPIVGMGGLGKTTLASKVYSDPVIQHEFPTRIWVHVSQELDINRLCRTILRNFTQQDMSGKRSDELGQIVYDNLKMTKYLIVLDDVWEYDAWEQIREFLPRSNRKGSKVLITTRNEKVARNASLTGEPYRLSMLGTEECFELLKLEVFGRSSYFPPELEPMGRRIAKACNGIPLATLVLGGILMQHRVPVVKGTNALRMKCESLCDSITSLPLDDGEKFMEKILSLSFSNLSPRLRICFLYVGIFPEDYQIPARELILLWVAEGFVGKKAGKSLEETAEACLNDLIDRNLLMVEKTSLGGKAKSCRVHDLIRDFCRREATCINQNLYQEIRNSMYGMSEPPISYPNCSRLSIHSHVKEFLSAKSHASKVRSLLFFGVSFLPDIKETKVFTHALKTVRILDASVIILSKFPLKLTQSVHLRYLTLSGNVEILPAALTNLWNLQTLLVYTVSHILEIKADIWELENLRHVQTNASIFLKNGKAKGGKNLQTLTRLSPQSFTNDVSNKARNLKELGISGTLSSSMCFGNLEHLETLKLVHVSPDPLRHLPLPNSFPSKLKTLVLSSTKLDWNHTSGLEKLSNLEVLKLKDNAFVGDCWDVVCGGFKRLEVLWIDNTDLKYWTASEDSFASVRSLRLINCRKLEEIPLHLGKSLEVLYMSCVTKFAVSCARKIELERKHKMNQGQERSLTSGLDVQILPGNI